MIAENLLVFVCLTILKSDWSAAVNNRPIIGILAQETINKSFGDMMIRSSYVQWLEAGGSRVVPIRVKRPVSYYKQLLSSINGVLFPGGGADILTSEHAKAARIIYKYAIKANDYGDYFPLWGTCLGIQLLSALTSGQNLLSFCDAEDITIPLNLVTDYKESRMFRNVPADILHVITTENVTANNHSLGISPTAYSKNSSLKKFYRVISTNKGRGGQPFISTIEGKKYPFYGTQWHPEKNAFRWAVATNIRHTSATIRMDQYFADFFVNEARKSDHRFPDLDTEIDYLINNYSPVFFRGNDFSTEYFFN